MKRSSVNAWSAKVWRVLRSLFYRVSATRWFPSTALAVIRTLRYFDIWARVSLFAAKHKVPVFELSALPWMKTVDRKLLFIVGNGPSRQGFLKLYREQIQRFHSISINDEHQFDLHPTVSMREWGPLLGTQLAHEVSHQAELEIYHIPMHRTKTAEQSEYLDRFKGAKSAYVYGSVNPLTKSVSDFSSIFYSSASTDSRFKGLGSLTYGTQASLLRAIWIGAASDFVEIVLVGIDLILEEGFSRPTFSSSTTENPRLSEHLLHATAQHRFETDVPIVEAIDAISKELSMKSHTRLWVSSSQSLLSQVLPVFDWSRLESYWAQVDTSSS